MQPATLDAAMSVSSRRRDGRTRRSDRSKEAILAATRTLMATGRFRPAATDVRTAVGCCVRTIFQHFGSIEGLHMAAIEDEATCRAMIGLVLRDSLPPQTEADIRRVVMALVKGEA